MVRILMRYFTKSCSEAFSRSRRAAVLWLVAFLVFTSWNVGGWASLLLSLKVVKLPDMTGKVVVVTGGNRGIGLAIVRRLAAAGATVVLGSRSLDRGEAAKAGLPEAARGNVRVLQCDLESLAAVEAFAKAVTQQCPRIDVLVLNAGMCRTFMDRDGFRLTGDGFEEMMQVNYLSQFHLTQLLRPALRKAERPRVLAMTSVASASTYPCGIDYASWTTRVPGFWDWVQYGQSKLANALFMQQLQEREPSFQCVACHPAVAATELASGAGEGGSLLNRAYSPVVQILAMRGAEDAAVNPLYLATTEEFLHPGAVYHPVGRVGWLTHWYQRVCTLQIPCAVNTKHPELWERTEAILRAKRKGG